MMIITETIAAIGWFIALLLGIQNYNLRKEVRALKKREDQRERANKATHKKFETLLKGYGDLIAMSTSTAVAKEKVAALWAKVEAEADEQSRNEPDLEP